MISGKEDFVMTNRGHVLKYGGKFSINGGEVWTMLNGHDVHFALNPKVGCRGASIAIEFHKPNKEFAPHRHPISEEVLIIHGGKGECYLYDKQIPIETGDIVFVPPGILHGTCDPAENTEDFVTPGIATLPQLDLYLRIDYDIPEDNSGEYVEEV